MNFLLYAVTCGNTDLVISFIGDPAYERFKHEQVAGVDIVRLFTLIIECSLGTMYFIFSPASVTPIL